MSPIKFGDCLLLFSSEWFVFFSSVRKFNLSLYISCKYKGHWRHPLRSFLTQAVARRKRSASGRFTPVERSPDIHCVTGWVGFRVGPDRSTMPRLFNKRKNYEFICCFVRVWNFVFLFLWAKHGWRVFENKLLRTILGPERYNWELEKMTYWRASYNLLTFSFPCTVRLIKSWRIRWMSCTIMCERWQIFTQFIRSTSWKI